MNFNFPVENSGNFLYKIIKNIFSQVPVQRVTKYPLLLARLLKATSSVRSDIQEAKERLKQAQATVELHLEHMNAVNTSLICIINTIQIDKIT